MTDVGTGVLDDLREAVDGQLEVAGTPDAVGGVVPQWVARPGSTREAAALLTAAARHDLVLAARGRGTALGWGNPPYRLDLLVDTSRMDRVVEHEAGDLVVVVEAGARLDDLAEVFAPHGQQLALDQPRPGATVGGTLSTARCGPRRLAYGAPRDLVLGVTVVRADGVVAKAGGKVVKNVAGYDLAKLVTGAYGTLGLITQAVLRLHPLPQASRWLVAHPERTADAARAALALAGSQLAPSAIEVDRAPGSPGASVSVLLEGTRRGVDDRSAAAAALLGSSEEAPPGHDPAELPAGPEDVLVKLAVPLGTVESLLHSVSDAEQRHGVPIAVRGSAGTGVLHAGLPADADPAAVAAVVTDLRGACRGGSAVVLQAPEAVREAVDTWGPVAAIDLMHRVKDELDPQHRLAPGRFVGGI